MASRKVNCVNSGFQTSVVPDFLEQAVGGYRNRKTNPFAIERKLRRVKRGSHMERLWLSVNITTLVGSLGIMLRFRKPAEIETAL